MDRRAAEPSVRVALAFFAALVGFGLKNLLDDGDRLPCKHLIFVSAVAMVLRFLWGSGNHFWLEYLSDEVPSVDRKRFATDLAFLVLFGVLAVFMCYASEGDWFLFLSACIPFAAMVWHLIFTIASRSPPTHRRWDFWLRINFVHLSALLALLLILVEPLAGPDWNALVAKSEVFWFLVVMVNLTACFVDVRLQLKVLEAEFGNGSRKETGEKT